MTYEEICAANAREAAFDPDEPDRRELADLVAKLKIEWSEATAIASELPNWYPELLLDAWMTLDQLIAQKAVLLERLAELETRPQLVQTQDE